MSVNAGGMKKNKNGLEEQIKYGKPNLIAFQETDDYKIKKILPSHWNIHCIDHKCLTSEYELSYIKKLSRRPFGGWGSYGVLYQTVINGRPVNVVNVHLETPRKGFEDTRWRDFDFTPMYKNTEQRYREARNVSMMIDNNYPTILLGDFNMPSDSRIYLRYFSEYINAIDDNVRGLAYTKFTKIHGIRIDHVLVNKNLSTTNAWVGEDFGGDHRPIFTGINFN
jgi:endonuclease/exonuclease/phosphatase family metal-dependent hydrolase